MTLPKEAPVGTGGGNRTTEPAVQILGDVVSPLDVEWDAEVNPDRVLNP